ncbi:MAG: ATP-binding protein [Gammaproteobacteria bacterium]|nr:ATP-binding protein [Gammaproteobacteria bacterium]
MNSIVDEDSGWPPELSLDQERVLNLLTGDRFYTDASAALREAVLNAIDAVHRRREEGSEDFSPTVQVTLNREDLYLEVSDNGVGMDQEDVARLFTKVGASAAMANSRNGAVGEFGIGVISYFMAGDVFQVETVGLSGHRIGLTFHKTMLAGGRATEVESSRSARGTTIRITLRDSGTFDLLAEKYPHWCRDVDGLTARIEPDGRELRQKGLDQGDAVDLHGLPNWVERALLRPVSDPTGWEGMTGNSKVAVLYRGVFVQEFEAAGIWGIEGSIDVDPKYFKPSLNRESFVASKFEPEVMQLLNDCHPAILDAMVRPLTKALDDGVLAKWHSRRWASLWLAIPRSAAYESVTNSWDSVFSRIPAFEKKTEKDWQAVSLNDIEQMGNKVYVAPMADEEIQDTVEAAVRLLYGKGEPVVRGLRREDHWMQNVSVAYGTTADLIIHVFPDRIPTLVPVSNSAEQLLNEIATVAPLFTGPPKVDLVRLGRETASILRLQDRLLVNIDHEAGLALLEETLRENRGSPSLIACVAKHSPDQLREAAEVLSMSPGDPEVLSPMRRQFIKDNVHQ